MIEKISVLLCILFLFDISQAACNITVQNDVIFLFDHSGSMGPDDFELEKQFAQNLVLNYLPNNTQVASMGFGTNPTLYFNYGTYIGSEDISTGIENDVIFLGGRTKLEKALDALLDQVILTPDQKKLLFIITDGAPVDSPCTKAPDLKAMNVKTIIIAIFEDGDFDIVNVECLVDFPSDVIVIQDFNSLSEDDFLAQTGAYLCSADIEVKLTEIKSMGNNKFIEYLNEGVEIDSGELRLFSNLLINVDSEGIPIDYFDFDSRVIPTNGRILVSENSNPDCDANSLCENFLKQFEATEYWDVIIGQKFDTNDAERYTDIVESLSRENITGLIDIPSEFAWELRADGLDNTAADSWRKSCSVDGSPGETGDVACTAICQEDTDCGSDSTSNTCDLETGCSCEVQGYMEELESCPVIPKIEECFVSGFVDDWDSTDAMTVTVTWAASTSSYLRGYKISSVTASGISSSNLYYYATTTTISLNHHYWDTITVSAITETTTIPPAEDAPEFTPNSYTADRWSVGTYCTVTKTTSSPSLSPTTTIPSVSPSCSPTVGPTNMPSTKPSLSPTTSVPSVPPSVSPTVNPTCSPSVTPSIAPSSSLPTIMPSVSPSQSPTTSTPTSDPTVGPSLLPSMAPRWEHPKVTVGGLPWTCADDGCSFGELEMTSNEEITVDVRIFNSPVYQNVTVKYALYLLNGTNWNFVLEGSFDFPEAATYKGVDIQKVDCGVIAMGDDALRTYEFRVLETNRTDEWGRSFYQTDEPNTATITMTKFEALTVAESGEQGLETIYWLIIAACGIVLLCCGFSALYYGCSEKKKKEEAKKTAQEAVEELDDIARREEDGFYGDHADGEVVVNKLYNASNVQSSKKLTTGDTGGGQLVQMVSVDDDDDLQFEQTEFAPINPQQAYGSTRVGVASSENPDKRFPQPENRDRDMFMSNASSIMYTEDEILPDQPVAEDRFDVEE